MKQRRSGRPTEKALAFLSDAQTGKQLQLFIADATTGALPSRQPLNVSARTMDACQVIL